MYAAATYGCPADFYVLGILDMEKTSGTYKDSPGWTCGSRNWQTEMEWVTGRYK